VQRLMAHKDELSVEARFSFYRIVPDKKDDDNRVCMNWHHRVFSDLEFS
jgi:hypothetical protein